MFLGFENAARYFKPPQTNYSKTRMSWPIPACVPTVGSRSLCQHVVHCRWIFIGTRQMLMTRTARWAGPYEFMFHGSNALVNAALCSHTCLFSLCQHVVHCRWRPSRHPRMLMTRTLCGASPSECMFQGLNALHYASTCLSSELLARYSNSAPCQSG